MRTAEADKATAAAITRWFSANARDLPWRWRRTGYAALVSEAMLQQTQVSRVVESYRAFMQRFPTVRALAAADEQDVLAAWQGLGYYRRARHLHAAATAIVQQHRGRVPRNVDALLKLPGVGRYTAGAIASIVFGERAPVVDGNVQRVLARLFAQTASPDSRDMQHWSWATAQRLVHAADDPGGLNEGMMELGATICTPTNPRCAECPLKSMCLAHRRGLASQIPPPKAAPMKQVRHHHTIVIERRGLILLVQRPPRGLWSSMWQSPTVEARRRLRSEDISALLNVPISSMRYVDSFGHHTTHRAITFHVYRGATRARRGQWRQPNEMRDLPMSNAQKRALRVAMNSD